MAEDRRDDLDRREEGGLDDGVFGLTTEEFNKALADGTIELGVDEGEEGDDEGRGGEGAVAKHTPADKSSGGTFTIIHNGVEHNLDHKRMTDLAQKGFDYEVKVGPHSRLVQLLDQDPQAQEVLNNHFMRKFGMLDDRDPGASHPNINDPNYRPAPAPAAAPAPARKEIDLSGVKVKSLSEYQNESDWLADALKASLGAIIPQILETTVAPAPAPSPASPARRPPNPQDAVLGAMQRYDPQHVNTVLPHIDQYAAEKLSVPEYREATSTLAGFLEFYDRVKSDILSGEFKPSSPGFTAGPQVKVPSDNGKGAKKPVRKKFNLKAGNKRGSGDTVRVPNVWDIPRDQFTRLIDSKIHS